MIFKASRFFGYWVLVILTGVFASYLAEVVLQLDPQPKALLIASVSAAVTGLLVLMERFFVRREEEHRGFSEGSAGR